MGRYHPPILARLLQVSGISLLVLYNVSSWNIVHGNSVQLSRVAFSVLCLLMWFGCVVRCFHNGERGQSVRVSHRLRQLGGWNRSVRNQKGVCVVYDRNGSVDMQKTASKEVSEYSEYFYRSRSRSSQFCQTYCIHSPKQKQSQVRSIQEKYTFVAKPCCR